MGTLFKIIVYAEDEASGGKAAAAAFRRIAALDAIMSDYKETSELMQLCAKSGRAPVKVSGDLFTVVERSLEVSKLSDGAFDVTVGPVVRLWRLSRRTAKLPDPEKRKDALSRVGWEKVKLDEKTRTVQLLEPRMQLDLGGIAKGYAADEALNVLNSHGIKSALVAAGGDIRVGDAPPGSEGWRVAIAPLKQGQKKATEELLLKNGAVSTSGDAEQYVEIEGKRYSHIVDPKTGLGLIGRMSVTVVALDGITSDSLTKVVCVLGPEKGMKLLESQKGVSARMLRLEGDDIKTWTMKNFPMVRLIDDE